MAANIASSSHDPSKDYKIRWLSNLPFWAVHVAAVVGVIMLGWSWSGLALAIGLYFLRMFGITAGFHRYFAHRSYKTGRVMQFILAFLGGISAQKGVLWWAAHHRAHHKYSDQPEDIHSPVQRGFFWSHCGWILVRKHVYLDIDRIRDFAKYPELRLLNRLDGTLAVAFATSLYLIGGTWALVWGYFVSTTLLWHGTFTINSFSHLIGRRRYRTTDDSRNNWFLALLTMGEGWHNNHHYYQRSVNQGFYWWEVDLSYYILKALSWVGLVWDLHTVPEHVRDPAFANQQLDRKRALAAARAQQSADSEQTAGTQDAGTAAAPVADPAPAAALQALASVVLPGQSSQH